MNDKTRAAMKQALEDICGAKLCEINSMSSRHEMLRLMDKAITALREALAEQDWVCDEQDAKVAGRFKRYRAEQAEQEQVAVLDITYGREPECYATPNAEDLPEGTYRLYAAPVRTKDLTDEEIFKTNKTELPDCQDLVDFARAVIAADREKNK